MQATVFRNGFDLAHGLPTTYTVIDFESEISQIIQTLERVCIVMQRGYILLERIIKPYTGYLLIGKSDVPAGA